MALEWLKTILGDAYTDDIDKKVSAEIGKGFVARADFNAANEAKKTLESQIVERDNQIKGFEKLSGDNEALKTQLTQAQEANKTAKTEYDNNLKKLTINGKIETALLGAKARDVKAARALLDESKISIDGENVLGLNDQLEALRKDKAWLFGEDQQNQNPPPSGGGNPPPSDDSKLSDDEFFAKAFPKK